jgi:hypothetical protein
MELVFILQCNFFFFQKNIAVPFYILEQNRNQPVSDILCPGEFIKDTIAQDCGCTNVSAACILT